MPPGRPSADLLAAFHRGCDDRIKGVPRHRCPYWWPQEISYWLQGWDDVHKHWGAWVQDRWPVKPLAPIQEGDPWNRPTSSA